MTLDKFKLDTNDVSIFMAQSAPERQYAARAFVYNFLKSSPKSETRELYRKLLQMCLTDPDHDIQEEIAGRIFQAPNLPSDIAVQIVINKLTASDWLLEHYHQFEEQDLLAILLSGGCQEYEQVANRPDVSPLISDYICQYGCEKAVSILLANDHSHITANGANAILERYSKTQSIIELLSKRSDLPTVIMTDLEDFIAPEKQPTATSAQQRHLGNRKAQIATLKEQELADKLNPNWSLAKKREAVSQLINDGRLSHTLLFRKLLDGDAEFFMISISLKSKVPESHIRASIRNVDTVKLKDIFRKAEIPAYVQSAFKTVIKLLQNRGVVGNSQKHKLQYLALPEIERIYHLQSHQNPEKLLETLFPHANNRKLN